MRFLTLLIACAVLSACSSVGSDLALDEGRLARLETGETTKPDLYYLLGQPHEVSVFEEGSAWIYYTAEGSMDPWTMVPVVGLVRNGTNYDVTVTRIEFDRDERLRRHWQSDEEFYSSSWAAYRNAYDGQDRADVVRLELQRLNLPFDREAANRIEPIAAMMHRR
ncbi:hypothetical protein [Marinicauda sp. Alg238-R41]|uniref:hypothetical protein n=1 Tax=Marinicauda sp. Alg238-R41 TaxID=2993447 RepID=UPI0022E57E4E|nr:hypothetical protein [Marinicauda sp. Alg238-R41]